MQPFQLLVAKVTLPITKNPATAEIKSKLPNLKSIFTNTSAPFKLSYLPTPSFHSNHMKDFLVILTAHFKMENVYCEKTLIIFYLLDVFFKKNNDFLEVFLFVHYNKQFISLIGLYKAPNRKTKNKANKISTK